jgi:hypothetical protein
MSATARLTALAIVSLGAASGAAPAFADAHQSLINAPIIGPLETMGTYAVIDQVQQNLSGDLGTVLPSPADSLTAPTALLGADSPLVNLHHEPAGVTFGDGSQETSPND